MAEAPIIKPLACPEHLVLHRFPQAGGEMCTAFGILVRNVAT